jgi:hypothetical protein
MEYLQRKSIRLALPADNQVEGKRREDDGQIQVGTSRWHRKHPGRNIPRRHK